MKNIRWILILSGILAAVIIMGLIVLYVKQIDFSAEVSAAIITGCISIVAILVSTLINVYFNVQNQKLTLRDRIYEKRIEVYDEMTEIIKNVRMVVFDVMDLDKKYEKIMTEEEETNMIEMMKKIDREINTSTNSLKNLLDRSYVYLPANIASQILALFVNLGRLRVSVIMKQAGKRDIELDYSGQLSEDEIKRLQRFDERQISELLNNLLQDIRSDLGLNVLDLALRRALENVR